MLHQTKYSTGILTNNHICGQSAQQTFHAMMEHGWTKLIQTLPKINDKVNN